MPLPTAPAKRAALLSERDYGQPASTQPKVRSADVAPAQVKALGESPSSAVTETVVNKSARVEVAPKSPRETRVRTRRKQAIEAVETKAKRPVPDGPAKLFVLDTNVLLHDPMCLFRFEEHDIFLPMIVLEELDAHKKGMTEVARNARQTSRTLDALAGQQGAAARGRLERAHHGGAHGDDAPTGGAGAGDSQAHGPATGDRVHPCVVPGGQ